MNKLDAVNFEIENYKKQMQILFLVASQEQKDKMLEELKDLLDQPLWNKTEKRNRKPRELLL